MVKVWVSWSSAAEICVFAGFFVCSWALWVAVHWRRHPSGKMSLAFMFTHLILQNNTSSTFNNSCATCSQNCRIIMNPYMQRCFICCMNSCQKKRNEHKKIPQLPHSNCDSLVYTFQHRCLNSYYACRINHFEDRAAVLWCGRCYSGQLCYCCF